MGEIAFIEMGNLVIDRKGIFYTVLFDDDQTEKVKLYKWSIYFFGHGTIPYACSKGGAMHIILYGKAPKGYIWDHKNRNSLDNRRENLRHATHSQNLMNIKKRSDAFTSKYKGVVWCRDKKSFQAFVYLKGKRYRAGGSINEEIAARKYDKKAKELFGDFANLNFPDEKVT